MNTLEELVYYCREPEPIGALLLTGEWGCGKTYLIEHGLREALKGEAVVLRISLFGISTLEGIHEAVKQAWLDIYCKNKGVDKIAGKAQRIKEIATKLDFLPELIKGLASTNLTSFIEIEEKIDDKAVILVFDDLERCCMDNVDVLGAINDYCENQKFRTIIVANQDKIQNKQKNTQIDAEIEFDEQQKSINTNSAKKQAIIKLNVPPKEAQGEISYTEIKEKIIQRTVKYVPDYSDIVHMVVEKMKYQESECGVDGYKAFIKRYESGLLELFAPDRDQYIDNNSRTEMDNLKSLFESEKTIDKKYTLQSHNRPHNIRSLKCAIRDFYRVYLILCDNDLENIDRWFFSFVSYVISCKADIAKEDYYGTILSDEEVRMLYPAFQNRYMLNAVKKWILHGVWDKRAINHEIMIIKKREKAKTSDEIVRMNRIMDIDEEVVNEGLPIVLDMAYDGTLTLDEYVQFIMNSFWARTYNFPLPVLVDWNKVQVGINNCINTLIDTQPEGQQLHSMIGKEDREHFTEDEWSTYRIIEEFQNGNLLMFSKNRKQYIGGMKADALLSFQTCQNKRYNAFDEEMAIVTAEAYTNGDNSVKRQFPICFEGMWKYTVTSPDIKIEKYLIGMKKLQEILEAYRAELQNENKVFALLHTDTFINKVAGLIEVAEKEEKIKL